MLNKFRVKQKDEAKAGFTSLSEQASATLEKTPEEVL